MAYDKEYYDQLQAYALGCLDEPELLKLRTHIQSGEEYAWQELGEYQNLAALLPSILKIELPDQQLKDQIARKLYRIRDEIRAKRTSDISSFKPASSPVVEPEDSQSIPVQGFIISSPESEEIEDEESFEQLAVNSFPVDDEESKPTESGVSSYSIKDFEEVTPFRKTTEIVPDVPELKPVDTEQPVKEPVIKPEPDDFYSEENEIKFKKVKMPSPAPEEPVMSKGYQQKEEEPEEEKRSYLIPALLILIVLLIAAAVYAYFQIYSEVKTYKTEVAKLTDEISSRGLEESSNTKELQLLLEEPETKVINLLKAENASGFGRVIINFEQRRGYLQLGKLPVLEADKTYQLWFIAGRKSSSLGLFNTTSHVEYFPLDVSGINNPNRLVFVLTEEPSGGSANPGNLVILTGQL